MLYTARVTGERFEKLAGELAERDRDLPARLRDATAAAEELRAHAVACIEAFRARARAHGAQHLTDIAVGAVGTDRKHVDCASFTVARGRWESVCVAKPEPKAVVTLVGPFRAGKPEQPCRDVPLRGEETLLGLEDLLLALLEQGSAR